MSNSPSYIRALQEAIRTSEGCDSKHVESVPVKDIDRGETVWDGTVEVFDLIGHPKAKRCYAWGRATTPKGNEVRLVVVLGVKPVDSPFKAVQVSILRDARRPR